MSAPADGAALFESLPLDIASLCRSIEGLLIHADWATAYGLAPDHFGLEARATLPIAQRLTQITDADPGPLSSERPVDCRSPGTCRDYALMLCSVLRQRQIPARVRCGFAAYFDRGSWEDHWICEYWSANQERWCRVDAQLDDVQKRLLDIDFDATDLPQAMYLTAGDAWRLCRTGDGDAARFGHGADKGLWFVRVNVVRDHHALNGSEVSPWDSWRKAHGSHRIVSDQEQRATDTLVDRPDAATAEFTPPWLV